VFVEVKARSDCRFGTPLEAVTWRKRQRLSQMAASYIFQRGLGTAPCRFDVVAVTGRSAPFRIEIVQHAFEFGA
jgi:putative endonuclease